ncbi:MAG: stage V sporulation protein AE [Oscillospiraceae bacterium]|nr:stage V sporulation protein AE [Oscillospiraceae bacterium]MBR5362066.1 stage V sporulation protein AE [Oscillospiraceae bacterium]
MNYLLAFLVGGVLCVIGQLLIDDTKLTPARILVGYVVAGVILGGLGIYPHLVDLAGAGATVPLSGFGNLLAQGIRRDVDANGLLGVLTGGLTSAAGGISAALLFGLLAAVFFQTKARE